MRRGRTAWSVIVPDSREGALIIRTPEGVIFPLVPAGPLTRFAAWAVDLACITLAGNVAGIALTLVGLISADLARAATMLIYFSFSIGYGILAEWFWRGQTLGKRLLGLRVIDERGLRLEFGQVAIRNLLRFVDSLPVFYLVGGTVSLLSPRRQRLGDLAAHTIVIRHPKISEPDLDQVAPGKYNSIREHPHLAARLRQSISPPMAGIALQALLRRDELNPGARVELFGRLTDHFRGLVPLPAEVTEGLTDEQYVRNIVDVLYRTR